jgi:hypothetical protein
MLGSVSGPRSEASGALVCVGSLLGMLLVVESVLCVGPRVVMLLVVGSVRTEVGLVLLVLLRVGLVPGNSTRIRAPSLCRPRRVVRWCWVGLWARWRAWRQER